MILPGMGRGTVRQKANGGGGASLRKREVYAARKLRRQMSPPEVALWSQLRGKKLGFKVLRQHPIGPYTADFYVSAGRLVIEVDGSAHDFGRRPQLDEARDQYMVERGYRVLRIMAGDVMRNLDGVLSVIADQMITPLHHPSDGPPPRPGEEQL
jgi:very-short-patch-repair endonuclease